MDGPSGSGKSSTSRAVASSLGLRYLDTGAMYRAITHWMLTHGVDVEDADAVAARAGEPVIESGTDPVAPSITVDGVDVSAPIRTPEVRARRRAAEVAESAPEAIDADTVARNEAAMAARDARDSTRTVSPLTRADGAYELDATDLTLDEVVALVVSLVRDSETSVTR